LLSSWATVFRGPRLFISSSRLGSYLHLSFSVVVSQSVSQDLCSPLSLSLLLQFGAHALETPRFWHGGEVWRRKLLCTPFSLSQSSSLTLLPTVHLCCAKSVMRIFTDYVCLPRLTEAGCGDMKLNHLCPHCFMGSGSWAQC
jgi:hypothetical protein